MELLKVGKDKRALKVAKKKARTGCSASPRPGLRPATARPAWPRRDARLPCRPGRRRGDAPRAGRPLRLAPRRDARGRLLPTRCRRRRGEAGRALAGAWRAVLPRPGLRVSVWGASSWGSAASRHRAACRVRLDAAAPAPPRGAAFSRASSTRVWPGADMPRARCAAGHPPARQEQARGHGAGAAQDAVRCSVAWAVICARALRTAR